MVDQEHGMAWLISVTSYDVSLFPPCQNCLLMKGGGDVDCGKSISQRRKSDVPANQATIDGYRRQSEGGFLIFAKRCKLSAHKLPPIATKNEPWRMTKTREECFPR